MRQILLSKDCVTSTMWAQETGQTKVSMSSQGRGPLGEQTRISAPTSLNDEPFGGLWGGQLHRQWEMVMENVRNWIIRWA